MRIGKVNTRCIATACIGSDMSSDPAARLRRARIDAGYSSAQSAAEAYGWPAAAYRHHENGTRGFDFASAQRYGKAFKVHASWLMGEGGDAPVMPDLPQVRGAADGDGAIALKRINIGFAMGDGSNLDDYIEEGRMDFDANLLRLISSSPAHRLVVADGIGDSMQPTLMDSDLILIDTLQTQLNKWDRIWALSLQGAGAVKRLGPAERGKVEIISDNPAIPNRVVPMEDVRIIGRVVWSSRRH
ncbi:LexA family transcriptional regulator [Sphingobium yanoikuyae]|uniref:LexA family transcriptional regulator n=1 Tax=Sphingobium yanoikuyae TaxID=13690 RepID=UPI0035C7E1E8